MLELTTISEKALHPSDGMTWIQYCFTNITGPGTGYEKARTSCNVKNRELIFNYTPLSISIRRSTTGCTNFNNYSTFSYVSYKTVANWLQLPE
jgi:hypothetical protein